MLPKRYNAVLIGAASIRQAISPPIHLQKDEVCQQYVDAAIGRKVLSNLLVYKALGWQEICDYLRNDCSKYRSDSLNRWVCFIDWAQVLSYQQKGASQWPRMPGPVIACGERPKDAHILALLTSGLVQGYVAHPIDDADLDRFIKQVFG